MSTDMRSIWCAPQSRRRPWVPRSAPTALIAIGFLAALLGSVHGALAQGAANGVEVRVAAQRLTDGRTEFALQERVGDGSWGERQLPNSRYFPANARVGRWVASSPLTIGAQSDATPTMTASTGVEVRVATRLLADGRMEFALQERVGDGSWGERRLPRSRYFPAHASVGRWLASSSLTVNLAEPVFERLILDLMHKWEIPGGAIAIVKDGRLVLAEGYGLADVEQETPVQPDSLFRIASISKPITAVAVLQLVEAGQLDLDDRVFDILDRFRTAEGEAEDSRLYDVTVRQLLQHAGGWDRDQSFDAMWIAGRVERELGVPKPVTCEDVIRFMWGQPLDFDPGTRYAYSNFGYCLLGRLIEEVAQQPYEEYVRSHVLKPLGITRMRIGGTPLEDRAEGEVRYYGYPGQPLTVPVLPGMPERVAWHDGGFHLETMDAHGGWIASPVDLVRFAASLDGSRPPSILRPESVDLMMSAPDPRLRPGLPYHYGLGWLVRPVGDGANWWHDGSLPGTTSLLVRAHHGMIWAATFNSRPEDRFEFTAELDRLIWRGVGEVATWPAHDLFAQFGYLSATATGRADPEVSAIPRWTLSGTVSRGWTDPESAPSVVNPVGRIVGAVVEVVDGPDAGRQATTDDHGRYVFEGLCQGEYVVRVSATGFAPNEAVVDLVSDIVRDVAISLKVLPPQSSFTFPETDPDWLRTLALDYPYIHQVGNVRVFSDISPAFSAQHAEHLSLVWHLFNNLYDRNRGAYLDAYYTTNPEVFQKVVPHCPTIFIPGARNVTGCYRDYPRWFIMPYQVPDFGTQLHEIGHDFLFATWPPGDDSRTLWDDNKWYIEGTAMYFEGGVFDDHGSLSVNAPHSYCTWGFRKFYEQDSLLPLAQLLWRKADDFHADNARSYSQSCMLFYYLEKHEPGALYAMIERVNSGEIVTNAHLVAALLELTGKSIGELEEAYQSHAEQVSFGPDG